MASSMSGRKAKLSLSAIARIDQWFASRRRWKTPVKVIAAEVGVASQTVRDAANRLRGYREVPRG